MTHTENKFSVGMGSETKWTHWMQVEWQCNLSEVSFQQLNRNYFRFCRCEFNEGGRVYFKCFGFVCTCHLLCAAYMQMPHGGGIKCNRISFTSCWWRQQHLFGFWVSISRKIARISTFQCFSKVKKRNKKSSIQKWQ